METVIDNKELKRVQDFWNANLCGKQFVDAKFPSKEFFAYYREFRYKKTHHLDKYINWQSAKNKSVLEIGLGIGADGARWAEHAHSYTGVDLTTEAVSATKIHFEHLGMKGNIVQGNAEALDLPSTNFDIVYSHGVLHHTTHIEKTFKEVIEGTEFKVKGYPELYIYMYNEKLINLAHGGNPKLVGKNLWEMRDTKGRFFNQELLAAAQKGGGAVEFDFLNPGTGNVDPKVGWAELESKTDCGSVMVGSGVYRPKVN